MTLPAQDSFTAGSTQTLQSYSGSWTIVSGGFSVNATNDVAYATAANTISVAKWNADAFDNNQYAQAKLRYVTGAYQEAGVAVRIFTAGSGTEYNFCGQADESYLGKHVEGVYTQLGSTGSPVTEGAVYRLEASGTTLTPKVGGVVFNPPGAQTDSSISAGSAGIYAWHNTTIVSIDDFEAGNLSGSSGSSGSAVGANLSQSQSLGGLVLTALPYERSTAITNVTFNHSGSKTAAPGSDLWPVTWHDDDNLYTAWGDGGGFGGTNESGRVSFGIGRISGSASNYSGANVYGGFNPENPATITTGKVASLLSLDGNMYGMHSTGSGENRGLMYSTDDGATWTHNSWDWTEGSGSFLASGFVNYGKAYAGSRDNYVYITGFNDGSGSNIYDVYLVRVPRADILNSGSYQYFTGTSASPTWGISANRKPIFSDLNNKVWNFTLQYYPDLARYILINSHQTIGQFGMFEASEPWGPWKTIRYEANWDSSGSAWEGLLYSIPSKWINGNSFWMIWSGSANVSYDAYVMTPATFTLGNIAQVLTVNNLSQSQTAGSVVLIPHNTGGVGITVANLAQAQTAGSVIIAPLNVVLVVGNLSQSQELGIIILRGSDAGKSIVVSLWYDLCKLFQQNL